jgi:hypothetical protein
LFCFFVKASLKHLIEMKRDCALSARGGGSKT